MAAVVRLNFWAEWVTLLLAVRFELSFFWRVKFVGLSGIAGRVNSAAASPVLCFSSP